MNDTHTNPHVTHIVIDDAVSPMQYDAVKMLLNEYIQIALSDDYAIGGAGLIDELAVFPGPYIAPAGFILLASLQNQPCGCLALRPITRDNAEVMRMYVRPQFRGHGIAALLMQRLIDKASLIGYKTLYLDSLNKFSAAHRLYEKFGFIYCDPYCADTTPQMKANMVFMSLNLETFSALTDTNK